MKSQKMRSPVGLGLKILFGLLLFTMLIGSVSAWDWDNVKEYNPDTREATIVNAFGFGANIAKVRLTSASEVQVGTGYTQVAEFIITNLQDYTNPLAGIEFHDKNKGMELVDRQIDYKYKTTESVIVDDYEESCDKVFNKINNTNDNVCSLIVVGNHTEQKEVWLPLKNQEFKTGDNFTVGIFTNVIFKDNIEWIPTYYGVSIPEWAVWTSALEYGLKAYYNFSSPIERVNPTNNNLTVYSGTPVIVSNASTFPVGDGKSVYFNGASCYKQTVQSGDIIFNLTAGETTINYWEKYTSTGQNWVMGKGVNTAGWDVLQQEGGTWQYRGSGAPFVLTAPNPKIAFWNMTTLTVNSTATCFYIDGTLRNCVGQDYSTNGAGGNFTVGCTFDGAFNYYSGYLDEIGFWNRTLSSAEITQLYNNGTGLTPVGIATIVTVNLTAPPNNTFANTSQIFFASTGSIADGVNLTNATLLLYGSGTTTNFTTIGGTSNSTNLSLSGIADGYYNWTYTYCGTNSSSTICSQAPANFTITIDTIAPTINFTNPTEVNGSSLSRNNTLINVTATDVNLANITINLFNSTGLVNSTTTTTSPNFVNITQLRDGTYFFNATATDTLNHRNSTETRTVTIDTSTLTINFTNPTEVNGSLLNRNNILVNVTANSSTLSNVTIYLLNTTGIVNTTISTSNITFLNFTNLADGTYRFNATATRADNAKVNTETRTVTIDTVGPLINITIPLNNSIIPFVGNVTINISIQDANGPSTLYFSLNGTANVTIGTGLANGTYNYSTNLGIGNYTIIAYANDSFNNLASSTQRFQVFSNVNSVTYSSPVVIGSSTSYTLNLSILSHAVSSGTLTLNGTVYNSSITAVNANNYLITNSLNVPYFSADNNISFYFNVSLSNGLNLTTQTFNQSVVTISIDNCTTNSLLFINYTLYDQDVQTLLNKTSPNNLTAELQVQLSSSGASIGQDIFYTFNQSFNATNPVLVCIRGNVLNSSSVRMDAVTRLVASGHVSQFYNIQNMTLNNNTIPIVSNLYDLSTATSQEFKITVKDQYFLPYQNVIINILRQYIPEGGSKSIEIPKTDINGQAIGHFVLSSVLYTIILSKEGQILQTYNNVQPICNNQAIGDCTINLNLFSGATSTTNFQTYKGLTYNITFEPSNRRFTTIFSSTDGSTKNILLNVTRFGQYGNQTLCSNSVISASGSIYCDIPASYGNVTAFATLYANNQYISSASANIRQSAADLLGNARIILVVLMFMTLSLLFISSPVMTVMAPIIGVGIAIILNLLDGTLFGATSTLLYLVIAGGIILYKMTRRE